MSKRLTTLVEKPHKRLKPRQFRGLPPELTDGVDRREVLPWPRVLVIEPKPDGIFLFRFSEGGERVGDTWHMSVEDAQAQAASEYEGHLGDWSDIPEGIVDPVSYALKKNLIG